MLQTPVELPGHPLSDQLTAVARWAHLDPALLIKSQAEIEQVFHDRNRLVAVLLKDGPELPWVWPEYEAFLSTLLELANLDVVDEEDAQSLDDVRIFHCDAVHDMIEHVADKLICNHRSLYRKEQLDSLRTLRPFWQISFEAHPSISVAPCHGGTEQSTCIRVTSDPFWNTNCVPWMCQHFLCRCRISSLSRIELIRYIEAGNQVNDADVMNLLKSSN